MTMQDDAGRELAGRTKQAAAGWARHVCSGPLPPPLHTQLLVSSSTLTATPLDADRQLRNTLFTLYNPTKYIHMLVHSLNLAGWVSWGK